MKMMTNPFHPARTSTAHERRPRTWLWTLLLAGLASAFPSRAAQLIRVLVWDEQQPAQKQAYDDFLGNQIAGYLRKQPGLEVTSARLDDPDQGLAPARLDRCDVLIWWGHARQAEVTPESGREIVGRILEGRLSLITLHSAHWSTPFVEAMKERARRDALKLLAAPERAKVTVVETNLFPQRYRAPGYSDPLTPSALYRKKPSDDVTVFLTLPNCCFPAYRSDGRPSQMRTLWPGHPLARGIPKTFTVPQTEMYDEPFHVPPPDQVVFEERWETGEWFRSGSVWNLGKGRVFYFRPGHETYPVYKNPVVLKIIDNAVRWLGTEASISNAGESAKAAPSRP
jgi:trehalose utilization protein